MGFMKAAPNAVAAVVAHHRAALAFGIGLNGVTNITQRGAGPDHPNAAPHGFQRHLADAAGAHRWLAGVVHARGVSMPAILNDGHIDVDRSEVRRVGKEWGSEGS